jgi:hypothetical protein
MMKTSQVSPTCEVFNGFFGAFVMDIDSPGRTPILGNENVEEPENVTNRPFLAIVLK